MRRTAITAALVVGLVAAGAGTASAANPAKADRALDRALKDLVGGDGPPGAIAVIQRGDRRRVHSAGVANVATGARPRARHQMRIASAAKAFSGGVALTLVDEGVLSLDDTIGERLPGLPAQWHAVTLRQLLAHTSGLPDFSQSPAFRQAVGASPTVAPPPAQLLTYVADKPLEFQPGSTYAYSNSDNVAAALMVQAVTGTSYEAALRDKVLRPLGMRHTGIPVGTLLASPYIHGYDPAEGGELGDVTQDVAMGGWAWASGGIVSTPAEMNVFVRGYVGGALFGKSVQKQQVRLVKGASSEPRGPGKNSAGLSLFRYRTRCGTVFGHTGNTPGYTQLIAANRTGRRSVAFTINLQYSRVDGLLGELRKAETKAVCAALARR
ncbi:MAG TPA: serine hydrolase domain-containing protein [Solirubrobacterales bacterium]|nr:serine hydrolase domain-containing protein [Solirubrobacterales bacterium]